MKNRDEYIAEVFSRRDEYKKAQKKRRKKYAVSGTALALCCAVVLSAPIYGNFRHKSAREETAGKPTIIEEHSAVLEQKKSVNLMDGIKSNSVQKSPLTKQFINAQADFSMKLFSEVYKENSKKNVLLSPVSVQIALAMTVNGAVGDTLSQMEKALGNLPVSELNKNFYSYIKDLPNDEKCKAQIADSIWYRDDESRLEVKKDFLQKNGDYYGASAYKAPFDSGTLKDINNWVKDNTNGKIDRVLEKINPDDVMYLINAVSFDAKWADPYTKQSVGIGTFTALNGTKRYTVPMMHGSEYLYIDDGKATGFVKDYAGGKYQFVALLPNENVTLDEYITFLSKESPQKLISRWKNPQYGFTVFTEMPKFKSDFDTELSEPLKKMGMVNAFDGGKADFSAMVNNTNNNIFIDRIIHKTAIEINENGTSAAAATVVTGADSCAPIEEKIRSVTLDRPFVYLIVDSQNGLPLFIGTVTDIK